MDASQEKYRALIGKVIDGRYEVQKVKGVGGMAVVLEALDLQKERTVAVKMLNEKYANDNAAIRRFVNESKAIALLSNDHIVDIYDVAFTGKSKYIVMEYIDGITLRDFMKRYAPLGIDRSIDFCVQILSALQHAHEKSVVHRDIKPQNIMVQANGKLKVTDFGIAQISGGAQSSNGVAMGTVYYISPEQASGNPTTFSSDLYSVGVMLYEMTTGKLPFEADTPLAIAMMQVNNEPVRPRKLNPRIPQGLEQIILKAMDKSPENRFHSAKSMLRALEIVKKDKTVVFEDTKAAQNGAVKTEPIKTETESDVKKQNKESPKTMFPIILGVTLAFLLVAIVGGVFLVTSLFNHANNDGSITVNIPQMVGEKYDQILIDSMKERNIALQITYVSNDVYGKDVVSYQEPAAGQTRKIRSKNDLFTVKLQVSQGKSSFVMEDFTGKEFRATKIELEKRGVQTVSEEKYDRSVPAGFVISTEPAEGVTVYNGDTVKIVISNGAEVVYSNMIDVRGQELASAKRKLYNANFVVGNLTREYSDSVPEGCVIRQSVKPGTSTPQKQTPVDLVVSLGAPPAPPVTEPPVTEPTPSQPSTPPAEPGEQPDPPAETPEDPDPNENG